MSLSLFDEVSTVSDGHLRMKARRHCTGCHKTLWGQGPAKCSDCREAAADAMRAAAKRLCCECGDPAKRRAIRCAPCWKENDLEVRRLATDRFRGRHPDRAKKSRNLAEKARKEAGKFDHVQKNANNRAYRARQKVKRIAARAAGVFVKPPAPARDREKQHGYVRAWRARQKAKRELAAMRSTPEAFHAQ